MVLDSLSGVESKVCLVQYAPSSREGKLLLCRVIDAPVTQVELTWGETHLRKLEKGPVSVLALLCPDEHFVVPAIDLKGVDYLLMAKAVSN